MEATILVCFDIDDETEVEILLPVKFTASKGYRATHEDPCCPDEIEDVAYDEKEAVTLVIKSLVDNDMLVDFDQDAILEQIDDFLADPETESKLMDYANQSALEYEFEKAEYKRMDR